MLNREEKRELRSDLFRHLDGIAVAPTVFTLHEKGVLEFLQKEKDLLPRKDQKVPLFPRECLWRVSLILF